jgi:hypothetical protein
MVNASDDGRCGYRDLIGSLSGVSSVRSYVGVPVRKRRPEEGTSGSGRWRQCLSRFWCRRSSTTRCRQRQVATVRLGDNMSMAGGSAGNTVGAILVSSRRYCAEEEVAGAPVATGEWTTTGSGCHAAWPRGARGGDALVRRKEASACPAGVQGDGVAQARQQEVSSRAYSRGAREQMRHAGLGCFF